MNILKTTAAAISLLAGAAALAETHSLNTDWTFVKSPETIPLARAKAAVETSGVKVEDPAFDDSGWEKVSLPHAINAHDTFDGRAVDAGEGSFWRGMAFYRKRFSLPEGTGNGERGMGKAFVTFETVRQSVYLWANGKFAGYYEAGIAPCAFDVTSLLKEGENVLCVATDNCAARGTKLFTLETIPGHEPGDMSGRGFQWNTTDFNEVQGGLVGNVSLVLKDSKTYLTLPYYNNLKTVGTYVTAKDFDFEKGAATICVKAEVRNEDASRGGAEARRFGIRVAVNEAGTTGTTGTDGTTSIVTVVSSVVEVPSSPAKTYLTALEGDVYEDAPQPTRVASPETAVLEAECRASGLVFWSPDTPHLYDVVVSLVGEDGKVLDKETIRTGFRSVAYDAAKGGLLLNGRNIWLPGYAQRSTDEWAAIGIAPDWLQDFDAKLIRKSNANFVRWMHVAPKPAPVRSYDKYGIVNACPAGDKEGDVSGRAWAQRMEAMRDVMIYFRNSPSIFFWEAGNNQISPAHMKEMRELKELLDPANGRFMGCRTISSPEQIRESEYAGTMLHRHETVAFDSMGRVGRFQPLMETEYARQESPRRCWDDYTPPDFDYVCRFLGGGKKETGFDVYDQTQEDFALSTAREYAEFWSSRSFGDGAKTYACCAALCWTDSNQHGRQSGTENCRSSGRVDAVRIPKMNFWTFRAMQSPDPAVKIVGHWSYPKLASDNYWYEEKAHNGKWVAPTGKKAQRNPKAKTVYVIGSPHVAKVELFVNGRSVGVCEKPEHLFVWAFPGVDVTESGKVEAVAYGADGKRIADDAIETAGPAAKLVLAAHTGPNGFLADGSDIAVVDLRLVDAKGRVLPYASEKVAFNLSFTPGSSQPPIFMGGYNSGVWDEKSPVGKDWVNLECGENRVFVKAGREAGVATLEAVCANGMKASVKLVLKPFEAVGGLSAGMQSDAPNGRTYHAKGGAPVVQSTLGGAMGAVAWEVRVNGTPVKFTKGLGAPVKPDDNTGVCCAYVPVLEALKAAGAKLEYVDEPKRIPPNKKWLRKLAPTPFQPMVTVKAGGREIDACVGFTELFLDNGKDKNLTNCEVYNASRKKNQGVVCGELTALVGYIPGVSVKVDPIGHVVELSVK